MEHRLILREFEHYLTHRKAYFVEKHQGYFLLFSFAVLIDEISILRMVPHSL